MSKCEKYHGEPVFDYKLCGKNLLDNYKIQTDFYDSIFSGYGRLKNIIEDDNKLQKYIQGLWDNGEELCESCRYNGGLDGVDEFYKCHILAKPCGEDDNIDAMRYCMKDWIVTKDYCEKIKEEKDMNKVLRVWYERKRDKVIDKYKEKEVEFYNSKYSVVESFNELVDKFNEDLESLYKMDKATEQFVLKENTPNNVIKYCLDLDKLKEEFEVEYLIKRNEELKEIEDIREEVEAQLSLSNDLEYQQEVLIRYGIIDKKTKKISE